jgi:hypothetical protein
VVDVYRGVFTIADLAVDECQVFTVVEAAAISHCGESAEDRRHGGFRGSLDNGGYL